MSYHIGLTHKMAQRLNLDKGRPPMLRCDVCGTMRDISIHFEGVQMPPWLAANQPAPGGWSMVVGQNNQMLVPRRDICNKCMQKNRKVAALEKARLSADTES